MLAGSAIAASTLTAEDRASVQEWDDVASAWGYDYEIHKAATEDGWNLTLFRILAKTQQETTEADSVTDGAVTLKNTAAAEPPPVTADVAADEASTETDPVETTAVTGDEEEDRSNLPDMPVLLLQHGAYMDATEWVQY